MMRFSAFTRLLALLIFVPCLSVAQTTPSITLAATNTTMPLSGVGSIPFTLTSVNGFAGNVIVSCVPPTEPAGVTVPLCEVGGPVLVFVLNANATLKENIGLLASEPVPTPVKFKRRKHGERIGLALAGTLMLGLGLRRKKAYGFAGVCLSIAFLICLTGIGGCAAGPKTLTPGTYSYILSASEQGESTPAVSAAVTVTVPAGIVVR